MPTATRNRTRTHRTPKLEAPLLEAVERGVWRFLRTPEHWFLTNIPAGALLKHEPAPGVMWSDPDAHPLAPWSVHHQPGYVPWGIPQNIAADFLRIDHEARHPRLD